MKQSFFDLCRKYSQDQELITRLWNEIEKNYSGSERHYHSLKHLSNMLGHLESCREFISAWDAVLFALYYHDIIYLASSKENEEQSASTAMNCLGKLNVAQPQLSLVNELILATKSHQSSSNNDINLFTDADLSILGSSHADYDEYAANVRKEYDIYPDLVYRPGRKKVLEHFLNMPAIFKTAFFAERLESKARENLSRELATLS